MNVAEREAPRIIHKQYSRPLGYQTLNAFYKDRFCGHIGYYWSYGGECWELENLEVSGGFKGKGIGRVLLQTFVDQIGSEQPVHFAIIHDRTVKQLTQKYKEAGGRGIYRISGEELHDLLIVRSLQRSNFDVETITVAPNPSYFIESPYNIELWGKTR